MRQGASRGVASVAVKQRQQAPSPRACFLGACGDTGGTADLSATGEPFNGSSSFCGPGTALATRCADLARDRYCWAFIGCTLNAGVCWLALFCSQRAGQSATSIRGFYFSNHFDFTQFQRQLQGAEGTKQAHDHAQSHSIVDIHQSHVSENALQASQMVAVECTVHV